jgi:hypothetical protein
MGHWKDAQEQLETILKSNPGFTSARLRLGLALHRQGDEAGARREWERCVEDDPRDMRAKAYLASLGKASASTA